ncbi:MAG: threonylcarbamoyl-AMP synthase [Actinobacteria bacterium]|nr:threonylcarbamoyl-AMP synthase [Actinomycetota bacterium]
MSRTYDCRLPDGRTEGITAAVAAIQRGDLIVLPTDTVYGVGADAFSPAAVDGLVAAKNRSRDMPVGVLVGSWRGLDGLVLSVRPEVRELVEAFWPGGLSLVVQQAPSLTWDLGDSRGTVMVRMPLHPVALEVLHETGPLAVSSANVSGEPPATSAAEAENQLGSAVRGAGMSTPFWGPDFAALQQEDPEIADVVLGELDRLRGGLQLIASENFTSPAVLAALGSTLSNKYAEGYPGRRYYGGCQQVDRAEEMGIARAKELFGCEHANLQPHSGASANLAAYAALLEPGDTVLAMALPHGGHLTHGSKVNFSGKWFDTVGYTVTEDTELIDYDEVRDLARQHHPKMIICGATAYPRLIDFAAFREIADEVGARLLVDAAHFIGLVAGGAIPSPVPYADVVTFTTHKVLRGPRGGMIVCTAELAQKIDKAVFPFTQGGPLMHGVAAKAVALREAQQPAYQAYARQVIANAQALADGLAADGMRPVSGGTDTHLALIDLRALQVTGRDAEARCDAARITLNKNAIPYDPQKPMVASGIRVGTPAVTTQGMTEGDMKEIAGLIGRAVRDADGAATAEVAEAVSALVARHPAYPRP